MTKELSVAVDDDGVWQLRGTAAEKFGLVNEFLGIWLTGISPLEPAGPTPMTCWRSYGG